MLEPATQAHFPSRHGGTTGLESELIKWPFSLQMKIHCRTKTVGPGLMKNAGTGPGRMWIEKNMEY